MSLTRWRYLSSFEQRRLHKAACMLFDRHEERCDFLQEAYALLFKYWRRHGYGLFGDQERLLSLNHRDLCRSAFYATIGRGIREVVADSDEHWRALVHSVDRAFAEAMDAAPVNPAFASQQRLWTIKVGGDAQIRLSYDELEELTGWRRSSIQNAKSRGTPIHVYHYKGHIFRSWDRLIKYHRATKDMLKRKVQRIELEFVS